MRGRPRGCWLLALLLACASPGGKAGDGGPAPAPSDPRASGFQLFPHDRELSLFMQSYPRAPDPDAALDRLFALDLARFEQGARAESQWPLAHALLLEFYATLIREDPEPATAFARRAFAETSREKAALCQEVLARAAAEPVEVGFPVEDAAWLDLLWARYYANGDRANLRQIARALEHALPSDTVVPRMRELAPSKPGTPEHAELMRITVANTAVFGLTTHATVDPGVRSALRELGREPGHVGEVAASLLGSLERPTAPQWMRSSGAFTALAFLTDDYARLERQLEHPSGRPLYPLTNHAWRGSVVDAVIWFTDCSAGSDGLCRARADFLVHTPDGSVYAKFENTEVWVGKPPLANGMAQMGPVTLRLILEPDDPLGRYLVHVTIRDEVGGHTLRSTLELFVEDAAERPATTMPRARET